MSRGVVKMLSANHDSRNSDTRPCNPAGLPVNTCFFFDHFVAPWDIISRWAMPRPVRMKSKSHAKSPAGVGH